MQPLLVIILDEESDAEEMEVAKDDAESSEVSNCSKLITHIV